MAMLFHRGRFVLASGDDRPDPRPAMLTPTPIDEGWKAIVELVVRAIEIVGVSIIAIGAFVTLAIFLVALARRTDVAEAVAAFRSALGRAILLGLEFLVAADIIHTVLVEMTLETVAALAGIVLIRTILSISLETEIEGRWPWDRGPRPDPKDDRRSGR